jgi:FhuF-like iron-sulfur protein/ferric iron reductase FhuF-like transporter
VTPGPYFVWEPWADGAGWRPLAELSDADIVAERVDAARRAVVTMFTLAPGDVPVRVIASITFLGWASRLLSPPLGAAVTGAQLPIADPASTWWRPVAGGPLPIAVGALPTVPCAGLPADRVAGMLVDSAVDGLVRPVLEVFRSRFRLSPKVLWGNVASALAGAAGMLADADPAHARRAGDIVAACLARPPLAGTGTLVGRRRSLLRNNCCLYYRIPGGGTCGDCVLTSRPGR